MHIGGVSRMHISHVVLVQRVKRSAHATEQWAVA